MFNVAVPEINVCLRKTRHADQDCWIVPLDSRRKEVSRVSLSLSFTVEQRLEKAGYIIWLIDSDRGVNQSPFCSAI